jgi:hypothetical protein
MVSQINSTPVNYNSEEQEPLLLKRVGTRMHIHTELSVQFLTKKWIMVLKHLAWPSHLVSTTMKHRKGIFWNCVKDSEDFDCSYKQLAEGRRMKVLR